MASAAVVVVDELADGGLDRPGQVVVLEQDPVLRRVMPPLDLALGLRVTGHASDVVHALVLQPHRREPRSR